MGRSSRSERHRRSEPRERWQGKAPLRLLVGPYMYPGHCEYMVGAFDDYETITFGTWEGADVQVEAFATMDEILAALPAGWRPDLMLLWRPEYTVLPRGIETVDFPVAMLISDWYVAFTACLEAARFVDMVVTGTRGERVYRMAGFDHVIAMPMLGYQTGFDGVHRNRVRDIDVFCAGNPNWTVHREREQVNAELLRLPPSVRLVHAPFLDRAEYNRYLGRSKIFVNQTVIGEVNMKVYEVTAAETCLFVEEDNLDVRDYLVPDESVVLFDRTNLNEKILHYLHHEDERKAIAAAGARAMRARSYRANMRDIVERLRSIGRDALLARGREIRRATPRQASAHWMGYTVRRVLSDPIGAGVLVNELRGGDDRDEALRVTTQYTSRARSNPDNENDPRWDRIPPSHQVIDEIHDLWKRREDDLPLNLAWAQLAPHHVEPDEAAPAFDRLLQQLESGVRIPLGGRNHYPLPEKRGFVFERLAWEQVEKSVPPDEVLRAYLLEFAYLLKGRFLRACGERWPAIEALRRAVASFPHGEEPRPQLARDLRDMGEFHEAIEVLRDHLVERPLDLVNRVALIELHLRVGNAAAASEVVDAIERIADVFCDEEWKARVARLRLGIPAHTAREVAV